MKTTLSIPYERLTFDALTAPQQALVKAARAAAKERAYAPYSHFHVGAALRLDNGEIVIGSNQENAATPLGTCAERTASFYAHSEYPEAVMECIAVAAYDTDGTEVATPITPCGGCRQVLVEWEKLSGKDMQVILVGSEYIIVVPSAKSLLPFTFTEFK